MSLHTIDSADMVRRYYNETGGHFFDPDTMRCFRSRLDEIAEHGAGDRVYFVTSERRTGFREASGPRTYTVRVMDWLTGCLGEASPFNEDQAYLTKRAALKARERYAAADRAGETWPCDMRCVENREWPTRYGSWAAMWQAWRDDWVQCAERRAAELRAKVQESSAAQ